MDVRTFVRPSRNVRLCTANKRLAPEAPVFCTHLPIDNVFSPVNFLSESSPFLNIILAISKIQIEHIGKFARDYLVNAEKIGQTFLLSTNRKSRLAYLHLTLGHCICQGHGHAHLYCEYLPYGVKNSKYSNCQHRRSGIGCRLVYLYLTLTHSKGKGQCHVDCYCEYLANGNR